MLKTLMKLNKDVKIIAGGIIAAVVVVSLSSMLGAGEFLNVKTAFGYGGGGVDVPRPDAVYQTYDPNTGELTTAETPAEATDEATADTAETTATNSLTQMTAEAEMIATKNAAQTASAVGVERNLTNETTTNNTLVEKILAGVDITTDERMKVINFVAYGTQSTLILGAGERAGVVSSYIAAFGRAPINNTDWNDVIKIGNGRWPGAESLEALAAAKVTFKKIYLRDADMTNPNDNAAVTVMAYGLRPADRNLDSEKAAIKIFRAIYAYSPASATDWDAVRAIAYSGATR
ncbi:MAG: hypothetical protein ABH881_00230 [bacterium]